MNHPPAVAGPQNPPHRKGSAPRHRWRPGVLLAMALAVPLTVAIASWLWGRPLLASDTATGLLAWDSWRAGGPWNCIAEPAAADLTQNAASWVSWWSPGQYVWPGLFLPLGLSLGGTLILSALVAAWIKSLGFYVLLRRLGLVSPAAALAVLVESASWHLYSSFGMYNGGEVLQAAFFPWLLIGFAALRNRLAWWILGVPVLTFAAAFVKHSMLMAALAGIGWLWWEHNRTAHANRLRWLGSGMVAVACLALAQTAIDHWLVRGGPSPGSLGQLAHGRLAAIGYPLFGPLSAAMGAGSVIGRLFALSHVPFDEGWQRAGWALVLLAPFWLWIYARLLRHLPHPMARRMIILFLVVYAGSVVMLLLGGASVSMEDRHFRLVGMLLIAAAAAGLVEGPTTSRLARVALTGSLAAVALYGLLAASQRIVLVARMNRTAPSGITQPNLSREAAEGLHQMDFRHGSDGQVFFLPDPSIAMETSRSRKIVTDGLARPIGWFRRQAWHGRVPRLTLVLPASWLDDPRTRALQASFRDYAAGEWHPRIVGDCVFITAGG